jgi:hypothetical protein
MNLRVSSLFVILLGASLLAGCGGGAYSAERDLVVLNTYEVGRIELATNAILAEVDNIEFSRDSKTVDPADLIPEMWYQIKKVNPKESGSFVVMTDRSHPAQNSSHVQVARQTEGQNTCSKWAVPIVGSSCEYYAISIH